MPQSPLSNPPPSSWLSHPALWVGSVLGQVGLALSGWQLFLAGQPALAALNWLALLALLVGSLQAWSALQQSLRAAQHMQQERDQARAAHEQLQGALRCFPDALALFDAQDRLIIASDRYREMNPTVAPLLQPGVPFEVIIRTAAAAGEILEAVGQEERWVQQRLAEHRAPKQDFLQALSDNCWVRVNECRTPEGGLIGLRTNVTDFVRQQQALQEARSDAQQARRLLVRALDALPVALEIFDEQDQLVIYNRALQRMFSHIDYPASVGRRFADMAAESLRHQVVIEAIGQEEPWLAKRLEERQRLVNRTFLQALSGDRWVQAFETRTPENYIVAVRLDVSDMVKQRQALESAQREGQRNRQLLMDAIEALPEGLAVYDADDKLLLCNTQYRLMYSELASLLQPGRSFEDLVRYAQTQGHYVERSDEGPDWGALRLASHRRPGAALVVPMHNGRWYRVHERQTAERMTVGVHVDVTELIVKEQQLASANQRLATLSVTDGLTGIHNRRSFDEAMAREWMRCQRHQLPLALLLVDIDHFKRYNDHYGHLAGDDCLRRVAQVLIGDVRRSGELVARYGGEEFVILLPGSTEDGAREVAQRCLERMRTENIPHVASLTSSRLTMSIGVASCQPDARGQPHALINAADAALYQAKQNGRARYVLASALKPPTDPSTTSIHRPPEA
ncbi:diguanylate cyclase [Curvibacter sp. HBC28]|uniref:diguanylate cyclase n=1 Tax=Curvibacter microcysteis TaxID=3026419 RepID=A0ABT5MGC4_9BURK|nr:diguanylate cyclase [Curvibacter sp. HBC28]MDD0815630.1 diguanylate cyclase [Curvibacter sp. HBC28]